MCLVLGEWQRRLPPAFYIPGGCYKYLEAANMRWSWPGIFLPKTTTKDQRHQGCVVCGHVCAAVVGGTLEKKKQCVCSSCASLKCDFQRSSADKQQQQAPDHSEFVLHALPSQSGTLAWARLVMFRQRTPSSCLEAYPQWQRPRGVVFFCKPLLLGTLPRRLPYSWWSAVKERGDASAASATRPPIVARRPARTSMLGH
jgi:hypothetical protein